MASVQPVQARQQSVQRAQERASLFGPLIFSGEEALKEVAKPDGEWDWALVGPDPAALPLSGGGAGGVEEMRESVRNHPHSVGLVRMTFGTGQESRTLLIAVHTSQQEGFSIKERSLGITKVEELQQGMEKFGKISAKIKITGEEECTLEFVVDKLKSLTIGGVDARLISVDNVRHLDEPESPGGAEAQPKFRGRKSRTSRKSQKPKDKIVEEEAEHDGSEDDEEEQPGHLSHAPKSFFSDAHEVDASALAGDLQEGEEEDELEEEADDAPMAPRSSVLEQPQVCKPQHSRGFEDVFQRRKVKKFRLGEQVEVWSFKYKKWIRDAEVVDMVTEQVMRDGLTLRAGSVKVLYRQRGRFKWIPPQLAEKHLRSSGRPVPPEHKFGELFKESHGDVTEWVPMHVEVNQGFVQWWSDKEAASGGEEPVGVAYLSCLQMQKQGLHIKLRADSTQGAVHSFQAASEQEAQAWVDCIWEHAGHCCDLTEYLGSRRAQLEEQASGAAAVASTSIHPGSGD